MNKRSLRRVRQAISVGLAVLLLAPNLLAERTRLKPGMNFFSPEQDIELGQRAAQEAEQQLPLLNNRQVDAYLNRVGKRLARHAPGYNYPYQFKAINQKEINAFALPGGFLYVNRGTIEAANNEAELVGVMAHEISHVALRHGTNQLSKATLARAPLAILGGLFGGGGGAVEQLAQLGIAVGFSSVFLKFSRDAETQADLLGTQMLHDAGYDPQGMVDFFETLQQKGGGGTIEFFSSHPNPENRQENIQKEIEKLGPLENPQRDSEEFHVIRQIVQRMPPPPERGERQQGTGGSAGRVEPPAERPSNRFQRYSHRYFTLQYPDNWEVHEGSAQVLFAPRGGASQNAIAYGVLTDVVALENPRWSLEQATDRLVEDLLESDPGLRQTGQQRARVGGRRAVATRLSGQSPIQGQQESDWLFTVRLGDRLFYALFIVPESDYQAYQRTFQQMLDSIRFR